MGLNRILLEGRIPNFDATYKAGEGEKGRSFYGGAISVKRNYKPEGEQYYPEDLIRIKAFGPKADFINKNFPKKSGITIEGKLQKDDDYEKDGQTVRGELFVLVEEIHFPESNAKGGNDAGEEGSKPAAKTPAKTPGAPAKTPGINPLAGKGKRPF